MPEKLKDSRDIYFFGGMKLMTNVCSRNFPYKILLQDRFDTAKRLTTTIFSSCKSARSREMERVRRGTSELRPRNVKASRRPGRKTFLVIHPSTGTGQAKNVNYGSAVQPERPHAPPFPFHAESCKIWHRPSSFLFFFPISEPLSTSFFKWENFPNIEVQEF